MFQVLPRIYSYLLVSGRGEEVRHDEGDTPWESYTWLTRPTTGKSSRRQQATQRYRQDTLIAKHS